MRQEKWRENQTNHQRPIDTICVECGRAATKGSQKHPYCKKCFLKVWNNDYDAYFEWLKRTHY